MIAAALTIPYTKDNGIHAETLCTSKEWSERFRNYAKNIHGMDIYQIITDGNETTGAEWKGKKDKNTEKILFGQQAWTKF